jgi:DNA-binding protein HU-beta
LIEAITKDGRLSRADATRAVNSLTTTVAMILKKGEEVAITGFGKFSVSRWAARTGRNPQTSEPAKIRASKTRGSPPGPHSRPQSPAAASNHR